MWGRSPMVPPQSVPPYSHTVPPCHPATFVMVQPPLPIPTYGPTMATVQPPYMLQPLPAPVPMWWENYPGPSYQQEFPMLSPPESQMNGYQTFFRKQK